MRKDSKLLVCGKEVSLLVAACLISTSNGDKWMNRKAGLSLLPSSGCEDVLHLLPYGWICFATEDLNAFSHKTSDK